jgi:hypothetical protein
VSGAGAHSASPARPVPTSTSETPDEVTPEARQARPWRGRGPVVPITPTMLTDAVMARVWRRLVIDATTGCLIWTGATDGSGYGQIKLDGRAPKVHRIVWVWANGRSVPDGLTLDHLCRVHACANPAHLEPVTHRTNTLRGQGLAADNARRTHCPRGHELTAGNLRPSRLARGCRACLACDRERVAERHRLMFAAALSLGLTRASYATTYGWSVATAREVLDQTAREQGQLFLWRAS